MSINIVPTGQWWRHILGSVPTRGNKIFNILISRSGNEVKRDVEFHH